MLSHEVNDALARMMQLWPAWQPNAAQEGVWLEDLAALDVDADRLARAVNRTYSQQTGTWRAPRFKAICEALAESAPVGPQEAVPDVNVLSGVWCVRRGTKHAVPLVYHKDRMPPPGAVLDAARAMIAGNEERHEFGLVDLYPGEWIVVQDARNAIEAVGAVA